jgi:hypothetical protein
LADLVKVADEMIPAPDAGISNRDLAHAETVIAKAYEVLARAEKAGPP